MASFKPIFPSTLAPAPSHHAKIAISRGHTLRIIRDQLSVLSWLCLGASLSGLLYALIGRLAFSIPILILFTKIIDVYLQVNGYRENPYMSDTIISKTCAQIPNEDGTFGPVAANGQICVFLVGARCSHPAGILAPGFKDLGDYFNRLCQNVESNSTEFGFLGASDWIANGERATNNTLLTVMYFKSPEGVRAFAHSSLHLEAWEWWKKNIKAHNHLSIFHEMFVSPAGSWETIYDNAEPMLMGSTQWGVSGGKWVRATVDASEGVLKNSAGRMGMKTG